MLDPKDPKNKYCPLPMITIVVGSAYSEIYYHGSITLSKIFRSGATGLVSTFAMCPTECKRICDQLDDHGLEMGKHYAVFEWGEPTDHQEDVAKWLEWGYADGPLGKGLYCWLKEDNGNVQMIEGNDND